MSGRSDFFVLVAEDDEDDWQLLRETFAAIHPGVRLEWVKNGEELVARLSDASHGMPDAVLLDLNMPRKDGRAALREIRDDARIAPVRVVVFTTSNNETDRAYIEKLGAAFVSKPFGYAAFKSFIQSFPSRFLN